MILETLILVVERDDEELVVCDLDEKSQRQELLNSGTLEGDKLSELRQRSMPTRILPKGKYTFTQKNGMLVVTEGLPADFLRATKNWAVHPNLVLAKLKSVSKN